MTLLVSPTQEPAPVSWVDHWERGVDPWHADAFKGIGGDAEKIMVQNSNQGARAEGWYALDWCGNVIGFIPDGTPVEVKAQEGLSVQLFTLTGEQIEKAYGKSEQE